MSSILTCFQNIKPVIGVIHAKGQGDEDVFHTALKEIDIYKQNGIDGILIETYFGTYYQVERILKELSINDPGLPYGVNCLNVDAMGFELAAKYGCSYLQIDSVVGHVKPRDEETLDAFFKSFRAKCQAYLMGGVRFKYQPVLSEKSLQEDLITGMQRCDAICVTQDRTGQETSMDKITEFREIIGEFPLFVCAGATRENIAEQLRTADGAVVGSYFKDTYKDTGDVCAEHVAAFMDEVKKYRKTIVW